MKNRFWIVFFDRRNAQFDLIHIYTRQTNSHAFAPEPEPVRGSAQPQMIVNRSHQARRSPFLFPKEKRSRT